MDGMTPYHQNRLENGSFGTRIFPLLNDVTLDRSFKLCSSDTQPGLFVFSDASSFAYGAVVYLRSCRDGSCSFAFVVGKSRMAPMNTMTIPRLERSCCQVGSISQKGAATGFECYILY